MSYSRESEAYRRYLLLERGLSQNSISAYMHDLQRLISFVEIKHLSLYEIELFSLEEYLGDLYDEGLSPRSMARNISGLKSFFRFMLLNSYRDDNPAELLEAPKIGFKLPEVLSVEEIDKLLSVIDLSTIEGTRNYAIIETLYSCGLRVSELTGLRFSDLFFEEGFIRVEGKGSKQRFVPISDRAVQKISDWITYRKQLEIKKGSEDILFVSSRGRAISRVTIFHYVREYAEAAAIDKKVSPHIFRHSFATHLLERGANIRVIQEMLGHEKITTTEIYTHMDRQFLREEIIQHHPRNRNS